MVKAKDLKLMRKALDQLNHTTTTTAKNDSSSTSTNTTISSPVQDHPLLPIAQQIAEFRQQEKCRDDNSDITTNNGNDDVALVVAADTLAEKNPTTTPTTLAAAAAAAAAAVAHTNDGSLSTTSSFIKLHPILYDPKFRIILSPLSLLETPTTTNTTTTIEAKTDAIVTTKPRTTNDIDKKNELNDTKKGDRVLDHLSIADTISASFQRQVTPSSNTNSNTTPFHVHYCTSLLQQHQNNRTSLLLEQCLDIFQQNMKELYTNSSWGYNIDEKRKELLHTHARFIVFTTNTTTNPTPNEMKDNNSSAVSTTSATTDTVVGFIHYRYCYDDDSSPSCIVLYVYEIQISSMYQKQSIGLYGMYLMEAIVHCINNHNHTNTNSGSGSGDNSNTKENNAKKVTKNSSSSGSRNRAKKSTNKNITTTTTAMHTKPITIEKIMLTVFRNNHIAMEFYRNKLQYIIDPSSPSQYHDTTADYEILSKSIIH